MKKVRKKTKTNTAASRSRKSFRLFSSEGDNEVEWMKVGNCASNLRGAFFEYPAIGSTDAPREMTTPPRILSRMEMSRVSPRG